MSKPPASKHKKDSARHKARCFALQALYQWHFSGNDANELIQQFIAEPEMANADQDYFVTLVNGVVLQVVAIDKTMATCLDRNISALNPVELAVLRLAAYEIMQHPEIPYRVIINEALELTKQFGATQGYKYINGVLDTLAKQLRKNELKNQK